ncbi:MAG: DUF167 domain-containing protein [Bdellovibrionales bacterium]|nr:DUF167 domain-containing protein [Bdellovibrionales bacterium]
MKILVNAKPNSRKELIEQISENHFLIKVNAPPEDGKANQRIIEMLSRHLGIPKSKIILLKGHKSKNKTFLIEDL